MTFATICPDFWTCTYASTANIGGLALPLAPRLELETRTQVRPSAQLREIDELLAAYMSPEDRKKAFELWKAALYEQGRCRRS